MELFNVMFCALVFNVTVLVDVSVILPFKTIAPPAAFRVMLAAAVMFPLRSIFPAEVFKVTVPVVVVIFALVVISPTFELRLRFATPMLMLEFRVIPPSARRIRLPPADPAEAMAPKTVISPASPPKLEVVVTVTEPVFRAVFICVLRILDPVALGIQVLPATTGLGAPPAVALLEIVTSNGSSNQSPRFPERELTVTLPIACRLSLEEVSTNPPLPPFKPPRANRSP
jgi:hypothetical protein